MAILTLEGIVENGQIRLRDNVTLPAHTKVYVVIPVLRRHRKRISTVRAWCIRSKPPTLPSRLLRCRLMPSYDTSHCEPPAPIA